MSPPVLRMGRLASLAPVISPSGITHPAKRDAAGMLAMRLPLAAAALLLLIIGAHAQGARLPTTPIPMNPSPIPSKPLPKTEPIRPDAIAPARPSGQTTQRAPSGIEVKRPKARVLRCWCTSGVIRRTRCAVDCCFERQGAEICAVN